MDPSPTRSHRRGAALLATLCCVLGAAARGPAATQTIAIVDAYNDPTAEQDLKEYSEEFGLPECTTANGCFKKVNQKGEAKPLSFPKTAAELKKAREGSPQEIEEAEEAEGW